MRSGATLYHQLLGDVRLDSGHVHEEGQHALLHHPPDHLVPGQVVFLDGVELFQQRLLSSYAPHKAEGCAMNGGE